MSGQHPGQRKGQKGTDQQGGKGKGPHSVEQSTGMSPEKGKGGYAHPHGSTRAEDEYLYKRYEHYGSEYFDEEEDIYGDRAQFMAIDHDFTPKLVGVFSIIFFFLEQFLVIDQA